MKILIVAIVVVVVVVVYFKYVYIAHPIPQCLYALIGTYTRPTKQCYFE